MHDKQMLEYIKKDRYSLSRFGDGEFNIIYGNSIGFQDFDTELANRLKYILYNESSKHLTGIPNSFGNLNKFEDEPKKYWYRYMAFNRKKIINLLNDNKVYCDSFMTRFYLAYKDKKGCSKYIKQIKQVWKNRNIVIVEGELSRIGIRNDLFKGAEDIKRILVPSKNAFSVYDKILSECLKLNKEYLFILSIGPTASILAYDLNKSGYQALDFGHIDLQYEYYLRSCNKKIKIYGKYNNEVENGDNVESLEDNEYINQIICNIRIDV